MTISFRLIRRLLAVATVLLLIAIGALVVFLGGFETSVVSAGADAPLTSEQIATLAPRGRILAVAADCTACHTAAGGAPFAGGRAFEMPFGRLYATNISPDPDTGIGRWTRAEFQRAVRDGVGRGGRHLYPAMPYVSYRLLSEADVDAIYAYLLTRAPIRQSNRANSFPFDYVRQTLTFWNLLHLPARGFVADSAKTPEWDRGRYLVDALGHCGECHTPRDLTMGMITSRYLGGTEIEGVEAPDISPAGLARLGFDREGLTAYLRIGAGPQGVMNFSMYDVLHNSTRHLAEADLAAMAGYLTSSAPTATIATAQAGIGANAKAGGSSSWPGLSQPSTSSLAGGAKDVAPIAGHAAATAIPDPRSAPGRWLYVAVCAGCHGIDGEGVPHTAPPMRGNASLRLASPRNMLVAVTMGLEERDLGGGEAMQAMPGFTGLLDDRQIADLANYLRIAWGGTAGDVTAETVRQARDAVR